jgi:hypothetical protein
MARMRCREAKTTRVTRSAGWLARDRITAQDAARAYAVTELS